MEEQDVREHSEAFGAALVAGDIDRATEAFSAELRHNLGEVIALLPLPANEATVVSVDHSGAGYNVVMRLVGETEEVQLQLRWKDRDGHLTIVEASHLARTPTVAEGVEGEAPAPEADASQPSAG